MAHPDVLRAIAATAAIYDRKLTEDAVRLYAGDLDDYATADVLKSFARCRKELRTFPTVADIIARISDDRPGPEEAWAQVPKDETSSVVWTYEMAAAFAACRPLLYSDEIAARMAFLEVYRKLCAEARSEGRPATWSVSLGHNPAGRVHALTVAVEKGRITQAYAATLLPDASLAPAGPLLAGPVEPPSADGLARLREIRAGLLKAMPDEEAP